MTITIRSHDHSVDTELFRGLDSLDITQSLGQLTTAGRVDVLEPLPVFLSTAQLLRKGGLPEKERPVFWRYLIADSQSGLMSADVEQLGDAEPKFIAVDEGRPVELFRRAIAYVDKEFGGVARSFDLSVIEVPAGHVSALWLNADQTNVFVPFLSVEILAGRTPIAIDPNFLSGQRGATP